MDFGQWYQQRYPRLTGHGLWLRGGELNTFDPSEWDQREYRVLFARASTYFDVADSFTHSYLYQIASGVEGVFADLAYLPPRNDALLMEREQVPWWLSTGAKRGPRDFDLLGISNSTVQELINVPTLLKKSGIPVSKAERMAREDLPIVLLGGGNSLYSSVAWQGERSWVDAVFVGESDEAIRKILNILKIAKKQGLRKAQALEALLEVEGLVLPDRPRKTKKAVIVDLNQNEAFTHGPVSFAGEIGSGQLQISEGCPCFCSFCAESWDRKPYRERTAKKVLEVALEAKARRGLEEVDLYSFNFNMHSGLYPLLWDLVSRFRSIGMKSQRFDLLAHDPVMTEVQHAVEKASFTCGLEGISPRLRKYLRKNLEDSELRAAIEAIFKSRCRELKIFLIATGREQPEDFAQFALFLEALKKFRQALYSQARIIFSMTPLVRFPWTPLEFEDGLSCQSYSTIISRTASLVKEAKFEFREAAELPEYWVSQLLVRSFRPEVGAAVLEAVEKTGFVYYRSISERFQEVLTQALQSRGLTEKQLFKALDVSNETEDAPPWLYFETGVDRTFLRKQWELANEFKEQDYCLGRSWVDARCLHCGGCPTRFHVRDIVLARQERAYTLESFRERVKRLKKSEVDVRLAVEVGPAARGLPRKMLGMALARALMLTEPDFVEGYRGFRHALVGGEQQEVFATGFDCLTFVVDQAVLQRLRPKLSQASVLAKVNAVLGEWGQLLGEDLEQSDSGFTGKIFFTLEELPQGPVGSLQHVEKYLRKRDLKYTLRKTSAGGYDFELTPQARKKGLIHGIQLSSVKPFCLEIAPGPKWTPEEISNVCKEAFALQHPEQWVRIKCHVRRKED